MSLTPISHLREEIIGLYEEIGSYLGAAEELYKRHPGLARPNQLRAYIRTEVSASPIDLETVAENVRLAKLVQKQSDASRIKNKAFREHARIENAVISYNEAIVAELEQVGESMRGCDVRSGPLDPKAAALVVHLSDNHFNELVNLPTNRFDFEVAAKRLQLLAQKAKLFGKAYGVERVVVFFGGDLMNSDRRLDELLAMSTNRAKATLLAVHLYKQFLMDLRSEFFVDCFGVTGNESRAKENLGWVDVVATDNYDFTIFSMLQVIFDTMQDKGMRFHDFNANEVVFKLHNETFLGVHGHQVNATDQKKCQAIIGKYAAKGINITHILCGHIHATVVSDYVSRNASLVGSNAYSEEALGFVSKAAQNIHLVTPQGLDGIKCDLQNIEGVDGYDIIEALAAYNARSADKAHEAMRTPQTIVKVVI
ncbi:lambda ser/thr protein phosphatase [Synechococcus phage S-CRES3]|nr:lambda ser/thr protein phosphatase [Synechococcus phage S-CRES3]